MSASAAKKCLDQLSPSFMYTEILKEILLSIDFGEKHLIEFVNACREQFHDNSVELKNIDKLKSEYRDHTPIWWYTYNCFLYSMVNDALRTMDVDSIVNSGFFIRDLHEQIVRLHSEQHHTKSFVVYYGQGLSQEDFDKLLKEQGGLLGFNQFLLTNKKRQVPEDFARQMMENSDIVGVLFSMMIDPSVCLVPFANVRNVSDHQNEEEILFSMHSIFRIGEMKKIEGNNRLWQVNLTLTNDNDLDLRLLTERIREETLPDETGWYRLSQFLIKTGQPNKAQEILEMMLSEITDDLKKASIYHQMGCIKRDLGEYEEAIPFYEKSLAIRQNILPPTHSALADCYESIGSMYENMGEYPKSLASYEKAFEIKIKSLPPNHPDLATAYDNIGKVYYKMDENTKALSYYEKALEINLQNLPPNHPDLATTYDNIGEVYYKMGENTKALSYYEKALEIKMQSLPPNHPYLATAYNNIGNVYNKMDDHSKALSFYERACDIAQHSLPSNHPELLLYKDNIEATKKKL